MNNKHRTDPSGRTEHVTEDGSRAGQFSRDNSCGESKSNDIPHVLDALMDGAEGVISSRTVVGEPVIVGDTTLIPLNDVTIGAGAGANSSENKNAGMGGFTAKMSPSAVLILKNGVTKVVNIRSQDYITKLVDLIPEVVDRILDETDRRSMMNDGEAVSAAFPENSEDKKEDKKDHHV